MSERRPVRPLRPGPHACPPSRGTVARRRSRWLAGALALAAVTLGPPTGHAQASDPAAQDVSVPQAPGADRVDAARQDRAAPAPSGQGDAGVTPVRVNEQRRETTQGAGLRDTDPRGADAIDTTGHPVRPPAAASQEAAPANEGSALPPAFDAALDAEVIGAALGFIAPRSLDPTTVPGLALWGLQGLPTLDPALRLRTGNRTIRLDFGAAHEGPPASQGAPPAPEGGAAPDAATPGATGGGRGEQAGAPRPGGAGARAMAAPGDSAAGAAAAEPPARTSQPDVFARPFPADADASGWGDAAAAAMRWAWERSATIREAGAGAPLQGFFDEIFSRLDPYSRYVPPAGAGHVRDRLAGQVGVGVELARLGANLVLATVAANGPAAEAGLRAGERLLAVDGVPTQGAPAEAVAQSLVGEEDSAVRLRVAGPDGPARTLVLHRAVVPPETVFAERRRGARGAVLVLRITAFTADTAQRLSQELEGGLDPRVSGVVIDLRGDRGGLLRQAVTAVALLLDQGVVATTVGRDPDASRVWRVQGGDLARGLPIVVLVDGRTASAAEIMAAALADQRRAVVVGSATTGKGVVQTLTELPNGGELFVTWSRVLAPRGWPLQGLGVLPQLCTSLGAAATARQLRSLGAGVQELAEALGQWREARAPLDAHTVAQMRGACPAAEGRDGDLEVARALLDHPKAYAAALLPAEGGEGSR